MTKERNSYFSVRLKESRNKLNLTQKNFADKLGITAATVIAYEKGQKSPTLDLASKIADFFNVSLDWLCGFGQTEKASRIESYADVIHALINISRKVNLEISFGTIELTEEEFKNGKYALYDITETNNLDNDNSIHDVPELKVYDITLNNFLIEWRKMKILKDGKIIDDDVYKLWVERKIIEFSKPEFFLHPCISAI